MAQSLTSLAQVAEILVVERGQCTDAVTAEAPSKPRAAELIPKRRRFQRHGHDATAIE
jgi:hypothetical protein